ncbi:RagB/SusD family nutrient uptake outer membrane protein [Flavilitoribacter nigricans]|uniref:RagB/SusD family nutrient uptake outer membrane protein n=1 Tax=Flavilitoribacter nigricans (strain ATCC 23147 / DSM 23189 / NBRC 102662 / NCIMB 1420 / SS-2) TaxID=1122177 RepID=A0A2D0MZS9_FLAN2|nr:RagB/SusD family nutrient uptake outer membrane protein [Flavilitoribacter nigricans]PHN01781.1 RagB/SusD family nutrient uptake outer membrane protein [Flavilitoribacter nigricans DSM 23189 = NBRC 102662]
MKNILFPIIGVAILLVGTSCNDEFLDRFPETSIGKENFFNSEEDLSIYMNNLYNFPGWGIYVADGYATTDNASNTGNTELKTMMTTNPSSATITGGWNWGRLRTINFFLENFEKADIPQEALDHFEGLARFFRALFYVDKVQRYSDVPWYDQVLGTDDEDKLYKGRDDRAMVVDHIFEDFQFAVDHIRTDQPDGAVDKWVAMTYMARYALYEGTYRKYHPELNLQGTATAYIELARDLAKQIMDTGRFSIYSTGNPDQDYYNLFVNANLNGNPEVILNNIAITNLKNSGNSGTIFGNYETSPSKDLLQTYLMLDGAFYSEMEGYDTKLFVEEFENRDKRLAQTYAYPGWELIRTGTYAQGGGVYVQQLSKNFSGYHQIKGYVNDRDDDVINNVDVPVLRYAEVLLIFAEANAELGALDQSVLDATVNVLRARVGTPAMTMDATSDRLQEARYPGISDPLLLEIRRERRIELAMEGYRFDDLMRWGAGKLVENEPEGLYFPGLGKYDLTGDGVEDIILIDQTESVPTGDDKEVNSNGVALIYYRAGEQGSDANVYLANGTSGTIQTVRERGTFEDPKYYYRPIPQTHVTVNPNLTQIFGWE